MKIGNLISCHSTNQFYQYLDDLNDFERKIRRGRRLRSTRNLSENIDHDIQATNVSETVSNEVAEPENEGDIADTAVVSNVSVEQDTGMTSENRGRYSNITFKEKLKTKGR